MRTLTVASVVAVALLGTPAHAQSPLDRLLEGIPTLPGQGAGGLDDVKIGQGLKEALQVGTANAVALTGKTDGYFLNEAIKILMPERLRSLERGLRAAGFGSDVDQFVLSMNRAAERAAPRAKDIFWGAIGDLTLGDARAILAGGDTAATDYFRRTTTGKLTTAFQPAVSDAMNQVGVTRRYKELFTQAQALPFLRSESLDLDRYVVGRALDGLFHVVAEQERQIRTDPAARTTELLREVFGR